MIEWLTTAPNPRSSNRGYDAGQRGWKLHAVELSGRKEFKEIRYFKAVCGLRAKHGWSMDMFIEDKCEKCLKRINEK